MSLFAPRHAREGRPAEECLQPADVSELLVIDHFVLSDWCPSQRCPHPIRCLQCAAASACGMRGHQRHSGASSACMGTVSDTCCYVGGGRLLES